MQPLAIRDGITIPSDHLSVSFTRNLDGEDAVSAARRTPSSVELRFDTRGCPGLGPTQIRAILAYEPLRADRRGTVRVACNRYRSRAKNLAGARTSLRSYILEALEGPNREAALPAEEEETPRKRRRGPGLFKATNGQTGPG